MKFSGFGCDTAAVINILAHRNAMQRALIEQEYRTIYSEELSKRLASELRGDIEVRRRSSHLVISYDSHKVIELSFQQRKAYSIFILFSSREQFCFGCLIQLYAMQQ